MIGHLAELMWSPFSTWDAWAAIGTIGATGVALFLPRSMAKDEWARQDRIRKDDADRAVKARKDVHREVCSAVDRVLAYREAAIAILETDFPYLVGIQAVRRVRLNTDILLDVLALLEVRPELSDGAVYSAVSAKRIAKAVAMVTGKVADGWGVQGMRLTEDARRLSELDELAQMVADRNTRVRNYFGLEVSTSAAEIRDKYLPLSRAITAARAADSGAPDFDLTASYY